MRLDIVIPTYDNVAELSACLESLARQDLPDFKVLVCLDGSTDGTREFLRDRSWPFTLRVLESPDRSNHGRAAARNLAIPAIESAHVLLLDSDMRLAPDGVRRHLEIVEAGGRASVGDVVYLNARRNLWARYLATRGKNKYAAFADIGPLGFAAANAALPAADLVAVGGFDETLSGYGGEDTELALRLWGERGLAFVFNAAARAMTVEPKTIDQGLAEFRQYGASNLRAIRAKHPGPPAPYWIDRLTSTRPRDRLLRLLMNPVTDLIVDLLLPRVPFGIQRRLLNYKVLRAVYIGFAMRTR